MAVGIFWIVTLSIVLLLATLGIGIIPVYWIEYGGNNTDYIIAILSQFGVGMLLGTSFMLIIPEGVRECVENGGNVGFDLLVGFLVVYLLDRWVQTLMKRKPLIRDNDDLFDNYTDISLKSWRDIIIHPKQVVKNVLRNNIVFALAIHGLSDGIALGTTTNNESLLIVVLIAIIIHKIPAVLSLSSLMITKQSLPKYEVISNILVFAASTPLGYIVLSMFNLKQSKFMNWLSGNLLLMSGGSLLYAAFTAFLDDSHDHDTNDYLNVDNSEESTWNTRRYNLVDSHSLEPSNSPNGGDSNSTGNSPDIISPSHMTARELPYDESIYILAGVILPSIISVFIKE